MGSYNLSGIRPYMLGDRVELGELLPGQEWWQRWKIDIHTVLIKERVLFLFMRNYRI